MTQPIETTIETTFEIVPADLGLEPSAKSSLELAFTGFFTRARELAAKAETVTDPKQARALRLEIKAERVAAEKTRKSLKEESLRFGKAIDGANNIYLALVAPIEQKLDDIEKAEERREAARIQALQEERVEIIETLGMQTHGINLGMMSDDAWSNYHQQAKDAYTARREREKREAEEAAAAAKKEAEEREAQRLENIRLKEEAEKREAELKAEREAAAKAEEAARIERERIAEEARKEREAIEAKARAEREAAEAAAKEAAKKQADAEAEAKRLRDAEAKRIADEKAAADAKAKAEALAAKKAAAAPDKAKLMEFVKQVRALEVPMMKSTEAKRIAIQIGFDLDTVARAIEAQAATL
jgi:hypothetical protein